MADEVDRDWGIGHIRSLQRSSQRPMGSPCGGLWMLRDGGRSLYRRDREPLVVFQYVCDMFLQWCITFYLIWSFGALGGSNQYNQYWVLAPSFSCRHAEVCVAPCGHVPFSWRQQPLFGTVLSILTRDAKEGGCWRSLLSAPGRRPELCALERLSRGANINSWVLVLHRRDSLLMKNCGALFFRNLLPQLGGQGSVSQTFHAWSCLPEEGCVNED